jgi:predicted pyridoxine 5'-phosphate oxidase superfamily flavin-nucleotide-binding protein
MEIPAVVKKAVEDRPLMYLATVDDAGWPNVAPMLQYWWCNDDVIVVGDMFMKKTAENVRETGRAALSMTNPATDVAYKLKGTATYATAGPEFDLALRRLRESKPKKNFKGCVIIRVTAAYHASRGKHAGELMAGEPV